MAKSVHWAVGMKRFTATEAKNSSGRALSPVKGGETVLLASHGKPVATTAPVAMGATGDERERLVESVAEGFCDPPGRKIDFADLFAGEIPRLPGGITAEDLIDRERSGRR